MDFVSEGFGNTAMWQTLVALLLMGASCLFIYSTISIIRAPSFRDSEKAMLLAFTIIIPVIAPVIAIRLVTKRNKQA